MTAALPKIRVGDPLRHESLTVFPLFSDNGMNVEYRLAAEALSDKSVTVQEISEAGSVPELLVENKGGIRVLFLEGEELVGAKQNRILNTSLLVPAGGKLKIPVSCVEQGRWLYESRLFGSSGSHSSSKLRAILKASVSRSAKSDRGHRSDQSAIWNEVESLHAAHSVDSPTAAMADAFSSYKHRIDEFRDRLPYVKGATGMAVAIGRQIATLDLFDKPETCEQVWGRMLTGVVFDALEDVKANLHPAAAEVVQRLAAAERLTWKQTSTVGEGVEYRAESDNGDYASALVLDGEVVHGSIIATA